MMLQRLMLLAVIATTMPKESAVVNSEDKEDELTQRRDEDEYIDVDEMRNQIHIDVDVDRARRGRIESQLASTLVYSER